MDGIVLGKFLPFHRGHQSLIDFASRNTSTNEKLYIVICSLSNDDIDLGKRFRAIRNTYLDNPNVILLTEQRELPQEPKDHPDFWNIWKEVITSKIQLTDNFCLYTSDPYGVKYAKILGIKYIPFNPDREFIQTSGTMIRESISKNFDFLNEHMQKELRREFAFVGPECTGKTTMTNSLKLGSKDIVDITPEYARGYLELLGPELTENKMYDIMNGQINLEWVSRKNSRKPFIFRDTNILTTYGYAKLYGYQDIANIIHTTYLNFEFDNIDTYFVLSDNIPFVKDPLRYGGDKRETNVKYWVDVLQKFHRNYVIIEHEDEFGMKFKIWDHVLK